MKAIGSMNSNLQIVAGNRDGRMPLFARRALNKY